MNQLKYLFYFSFIAVFMISCSSAHYNMKHTDNFSLKSEPVGVKYRVKIGEPIEGKATMTKILWFIKIPSTMNISENVYASNNTQAPLFGGLEIAGLASPLNTLTGFLSIFQPLLNLFTSSNDMLNMSKASAVYNACHNDGYNIILTPTYECKLKDYFFFKRVSAVVRGTGAHIEHIAIEDMDTPKEPEKMILVK